MVVIMLKSMVGSAIQAQFSVPNLVNIAGRLSIVNSVAEACHSVQQGLIMQSSDLTISLFVWAEWGTPGLV